VTVGRSVQLVRVFMGLKEAKNHIEDDLDIYMVYLVVLIGWGDACPVQNTQCNCAHAVQRHDVTDKSLLL